MPVIVRRNVSVSLLVRLFDNTSSQQLESAEANFYAVCDLIRYFLLTLSCVCWFDICLFLGSFHFIYSYLYFSFSL